MWKTAWIILKNSEFLTLNFRFVILFAEKSKVFNFTNTFFNIAMMIIHYSSDFCIYSFTGKIFIFGVRSRHGIGRTAERIEAEPGRQEQGAPVRRSRIFAVLTAKQNQRFAGRRPAFGSDFPEAAGSPTLMFRSFSAWESVLFLAEFLNCIFRDCQKETCGRIGSAGYDAYLY